MNQLIIKAIYETLYMMFISGWIALAIGFPLGVFVFLSSKGQLLENAWLHKCLSLIANATRSIPFIILMVLLVPFTRLIVGSSIGMQAAIVPLSIGAAPFIARLVESAFTEIPKSLIETAQTMGASTWQIVWQILLPESLPNLVRGLTLTLISLIGYTAMAGAIGGGGLGDLAIRYGYQRFDQKIMLITTLILILMVQGIQWGGG